MINLITGLPGASKTLNTLRMVEQECKGREIYYYGIKDCQMPWTALTLDELHNWMALPNGAVIVIDEAQDVFPPIPNTRPSPVSVQEMAKHRHQGKDFFVITQDPTFVDAKLRKLAGPHFHYERVFARKGAKEIRFEKAITNPSDKSARSTAQIQWRGFDKRFFDKYKSAEIHTYKPKIPRTVYVVGAGLLAVAVLASTLLNSWGFFGGHSDKRTIVMGDAAPIETVQPAGVQLPDNFSGGEQVLNAEQYAAQFEPRIKDFPHTAPVYDKVTEVKTFPRPQCMLHERTQKCRCFTQQATPIDVTHSTCISIVRNGWFNPYQPDKTENAEGRAPAGAAPAVTQETPQEVGMASVTVIPDTTKYAHRGESGPSQAAL